MFQSTPAGVLASGWLEVSMKDRLGSNAIFSATPGDGSPRPAKVLESRNALEWGETDLELVLSVDNLYRSIAMGSTLTVECSGVTDGTHLSIPREALLTLAGGHFVYAVNGDFLTRTPVKLGASGSARVEVVDGLLAGDQVVQKGAMALWMIEMQAINGGDLCCPAAGHK
ncbi:MAG: hypothetical protein FJ405_19005 [Verrucomicrobia bacterium]|nr:hypothetical protein [Verrucomicrobiota bacterium]